jgi:hypothetical protein
MLSVLMSKNFYIENRIALYVQAAVGGVVQSISLHSRSVGAHGAIPVFYFSY